MTDPRHDEAARHLAAARQQRRPIERLPEGCRPVTHEDAFSVQRRVLQHLGERIAGWKVSLPRGDDLLVAPLPASTLQQGPSATVRPVGGQARIEPEVAFVIAHDLGPRSAEYGEEEVRDAIGDTRLVLELIGSRYSDPKAVPFVESLADSFNNQGMLLGPSLADPFTTDLSGFTVSIGGPAGTVLTQEGKHPNGHPLRPLVWLANFLRARGETLEAGHLVTTGSYAGMLDVPLATPLEVAFGNLGAIEVTLMPEGASRGPAPA